MMLAGDSNGNLIRTIDFNDGASYGQPREQPSENPPQSGD